MAGTQRQYFVYILTTKRNTVLYTGMTNSLRRRMSEHRSKVRASFTQRYNVTKLVYYEVYDRPYDAIVREKRIKGGSREAKIRLIEGVNPGWKDLADDVMLL